MTPTNLKVRRFANGVQCSALALVLISAHPFRAKAQDAHSHVPKQQTETTKQQQDDANSLIKIVRDATERFKDVKAAEAAGYSLQFGCVSGDDFGAMGLHYVNADLVGSGILDATRPHIVIYEAMPDGSRQLIGVDYLLIAAAWDATHSGPPQLMGQLFHLFPSPNRFGLPPFYTLHVWAWKNNPKGAFVNWHSNVSCSSYTDQN